MSEAPPDYSSAVALDSKWRSRAFAALGFLVAPLVPAVALPYLTPFASGPDYPRYDPLGIIFFYLVSLELGALFGIPSFLILRKFNLASVWSASIVGACIGGGVSFLFGGSQTPAFLFFSWTGSGAAAAVVFWFVWQSRGSNAQQPVPKVN